MKLATTAIAAVLTIAAINVVNAQDYAIRGTNNGTPVIHHHASTYTEGALRGSADYIRGVGDYNYNTSLALINREIARGMAYDNEIKKVQTYFGKRALNREYRQAENPRHTSEDIARYMAKRPVAPLNNQQINRQLNAVYWPAVLLQDAFGPQRQAIEQLLAQRTVADSGKGSVNDLQIKQAIDSMRTIVKGNARNLGSKHYIIAKRFLDGLEAESATPVGIQGLASTR